MSRICYLIIWQFIFLAHCFPVVRIITFHCNFPHLLEMQCKALNKFMVEDFELIVLDDAQDPLVTKRLKQICQTYDAKYVRFLPEWHAYNSPLNAYFRYLMDTFPPVRQDQSSRSWRHTRMIQYGLDTYGYNHNDIVVILDGDAFPIRTLSLRQILNDHNIAGTLRKGVNCEYLMPVFVAFDPRKLKQPSDFHLHWDYLFNTYQDTGAYTYHYFNDHPEVTVLKIPFLRGDVLSHLSTENYTEKNLEQNEIELIEKFRNFYYEIHMDWHIFHFKGSSFTLRPERTRSVSEFLDKLLLEELPPLRKIRFDSTAEVFFPGDDHD